MKKNIPWRFGFTGRFLVQNRAPIIKSYLQVTSQKLARSKLVHLHGRRSLALPSVGSSELKVF
ncbi:hypothetical protein AAG906_020688 [Vitis piasezkii]